MQPDGLSITQTQQTTMDIYYLLFLLGLTLRTTRSCGGACSWTNAYFLGKHVSWIAKWEGNSLKQGVINRVIHRSWGE